MNDLLHGLLMHSGNDAAHALAMAIGAPEGQERSDPGKTDGRRGAKINTLATKLGARHAVATRRAWTARDEHLGL